MAGAPDSYVDMESWLKANDTELYDQINELNQSSLSNSWISEKLNRFMKWLTV